MSWSAFPQAETLNDPRPLINRRRAVRPAAVDMRRQLTRSVSAVKTLGMRAMTMIELTKVLHSRVEAAISARGIVQEQRDTLKHDARKVSFTKAGLSG